MAGCWHSVAHREDSVMEQVGHLSSECGRSGRAGLESRRDQGAGHASGDLSIRVGRRDRESARGEQVVGGNRVGARFAGCLADSPPMRGPALGGLPGESQAKEDVYRLATLTMRMGGLGLRSATRMAPAAYWASWADALHMVQERLPALAQTTAIQLEQAEEPAACLGELRAAATCLDRHGFVRRPGWVDLQMGVRPPPVDESEPGEWALQRWMASCTWRPGMTRSSSTLNSSMATDAGWWWSLSRLAVAGALKQPISLNDWDPHDRNLMRKVVRQFAVRPVLSSALAGVDGEMPCLVEVALEE